MKAIATVNFKGGVGKTTITWLLAKYGAEYKGKKILVFDIDAQMSLTLAVQLQESGRLDESFEKWYFHILGILWIYYKSSNLRCASGGLILTSSFFHLSNE